MTASVGPAKGSQVSMVLIRQFCDTIGEPYPTTEAELKMIIARMIVLGMQT
jgi:hypothetical protein